MERPRVHSKERGEERTVRDDRRDIIPVCVLKVNVHNYDVRGSAITIVTLSPYCPGDQIKVSKCTSTFDADTDVPL